MKEKAIERGLLPPKSSFYKREIQPFFTGDYHGSSSEDDDSETEKKKLKEMRRTKRKLEREEKAAMLAKIVDGKSAKA